MALLAGSKDSNTPLKKESFCLLHEYFALRANGTTKNVLGFDSENMATLSLVHGEVA